MKEEKRKKSKHEDEILGHDECDCGHDCECDECSCDDECTCGCHDGKECDCKSSDEGCGCHGHENDCQHQHGEGCCEHEHHHGHHHHEEDCQCCGHGSAEELAGQYLAMAQRLQADFDNYRKHVAEQLDYQKEEGKRSVIEVFLPCLDTFKEAKKSISDENVLSGINMIEEKILNALSSLKVEKIETCGQKFDHNTMEVIAVMKDESKENDIILDEFQAGYTFNGKVIRYSKVIVNKID